jgi:transposase
MSEVTTIGIDLAKKVFQVHGVDAGGMVLVRKTIRRAQVLSFFRALPRCLVGMEACATSHYWAREIAALGHEVRLMPPQYVKAYVKRNKNDAADAEAICEAVRRPSMRFVPVKSAKQQAVLTMHRARDLLVRQRTMLVNALRAHLAEFGVIGAQGMHRVCDLRLFCVAGRSSGTRSRCIPCWRACRLGSARRQGPRRRSRSRS